jgi:long-subunit fatty acid transport protein
MFILKKTKWLCTIILLLAAGKSFSQSFGLGSWNILNIKYKINEKWSVFGEAQLRSLKFYDDFHYHEYKGGVNFKFHPNAVATLAAGDYDTYREGGNFSRPKNNAEFRLWPQIVLTQSIGNFKIEQRYRAEFRFTSNGYRNRFRYRLGASYPFGDDKAGYKPYQITVSNELFFTDREPYFERNRALISYGYRMSKYISVQAGYLHQFDYKINDETGRDFLQLGIYFDFFNKPEKLK